MIESAPLGSGLHVPRSALQRSEHERGIKALRDAGRVYPQSGQGSGGWTRMALSMGGNQVYNVYENRLRDYESFLRAIDIPWVWPAVTTISWSYAAAPFTIIDGRGGPEVPKDDPVYLAICDLLDQPNPFQSGDEIKDLLAQHLSLTGNAFMVLDRRNGKGWPTEIYLLRPSMVRILPDPKEYVSLFTYEANGQMIPFDPKDVVWFKRASSRDQYWGMGSVEPGTTTFNKQRAIARTEESFFDSGARIKGVLTYDGMLSEDQIEALRIAWREMDEGQSAQFKTAILQAGVDYKTIQSDLVEHGSGMEILSKMARDEILALFGVPKQKIGIFEDANYRSVEADSYFQAETLRPLLRATNYGWTKLVQQFNPKWRYRFHENVVTDYLSKAQTAHFMAQSACYKRNQILEITGSAQLDEDDPRGEEIVGPTSMTVFYPGGPAQELKLADPGTGAQGMHPQNDPVGQGPAGPLQITTPGALVRQNGASGNGNNSGASLQKPLHIHPQLLPGGKALCGCPERVEMGHKSQDADELGVCSQHAGLVNALLGEGRRRSYSLQQLQEGYPKERYAGVNGLLAQERTA